MNTLKKSLQPNKRAFKYRCLLLLFMVLFSTNIIHAQRNIYVDVNKTEQGDGSAENPYMSLGDAAYIANLNLNEEVIIYASGTADTYNYLTFDNRNTPVTIKSYGNGLILKNSENYPIMFIGSSGDVITLEGITFRDNNFTSTLFVDASINQGYIDIIDCKFINLSWTTDVAAQGSPQSYNDYLHPISITFGPNPTFGGIRIADNIFDGIALGYGRLIDFNSTDYSPTLATTGFDTRGNTASDIILPFNPATATEFYIDASVPAGTSGYGGVGSQDDPWKYLTAANFGAVFNDWSTNPATQIDKDVVIYFRGGTHTLSSIMYLEGISPNSSLALKPYPGETAILDGSNLTGAFTSMIACHDCYNTTIDGLKLTGLTTDVVAEGAYDTRFGIIFNGKGDNINIINNEIYDMHWTNDELKKLNPLQSNNLGAIQVVGIDSTPITNVTISGNNVHDITPGWTEAIAVNGNVDGFTISNNTVTDIRNIGIVAAGNYGWLLEQDGATLSAGDNQARNGVISGNTVTGCISPIAVSAGLYLDGSLNVEVMNNISNSNGVGMSVGNEVYDSSSGGHTIHDNTFANNLLAGMYIGSTSSGSNVDDVEVYNNTTNNNFNLDPTYLALANGNYGGDVWFDIEMTQVTNLKFYNNEINPNSNYILNKRYAETHTGHDYYNNTYTIPDSHADLQPTFRDETTANVTTLHDWENHKARGLDDIGSVLVGVIYDENNLALLGTATQSTTSHGGLAERAIDGDPNGSWSNASVTHTTSGIGQWWEVALADTYNIGDIVIYNRSDNCCVDRLENFTLNVLDDDRNVTHTYVSTTTVDGSITFNANGAIGRYVQIVQDENSPLSLAEVKVFAGTPELLKDDLTFLDPYDDYGNKWFETAQDKTDFLNAILTATGTTEDTAPASLKNDLFVASVRSDDDLEYDNKNYHTIVLTKSDTMGQSFNDLTHNFPDRHVYTVNFYLGENMTYAEFLLDEDVPTGYWGESLINLPYGEILTATDVNASRNIWVNITSDFNSIMNSLTLWGN